MLAQLGSPGWQLGDVPGPLQTGLGAFGGLKAFVATSHPLGRCKVG